MSDSYNPMDPHEIHNPQENTEPRQEDVGTQDTPVEQKTPFVWNSDGTYHYATPQ